MLWLIFSLFCLAFAYIGEKGGNSRSGTLAKILLIITMSLMTGLSGQVSIDHYNYREFYSIADSFSYFRTHTLDEVLFSRGYFEFGYCLLNIICNYLGLSYVGFFVVIAIITNTFIVKAFYKFPNPVIAILLFILSTHFYYETNLVRQMLAIAGFLYSMQYLVNKDYKRYIISILLIAQIHTSAYVLLPFVFIILLNNDKRQNIASMGIGILWLLSLFVLVSGKSISSVFVWLDFLLGDTTYAKYTSDEDLTNTGFAVSYIYNVFVLISYLLYNLNKKWDRKYFEYFLFFQFGAVLLNLASAAPNMNRFALYFSITQFVIIPYMAKTMTTGNIKYNQLNTFIRNGVIIYYGAYILLVNFILNPNQILGSKMYSILDFFK